MNKKMASAALAAMFALSAGSALAFPVEFHGDFRLQGRSFDNDIVGTAGGESDESFFQYRLRLHATGQIDEDTSFFLRFSDRNRLGAKSNSENSTTGELDWYGIKGKLGDWNYSVGRQSVTLGQGSIISTGDDAAGPSNMFDGVILSTKAGQANVQVIAGKTTEDQGPAKEWYGFDASTQISDKVKAGVAFAKDGDADINYWALNTNIKVSPQFDLAAEYSKSDAETLDTAYFVAGTYSWDKNSFTVQYQDVEANAADPNNSGIGGISYPMGVAFINDTTLANESYSGFSYIYGRSIKENLSFHAVYLDLEADGKPGSANEIAAGLVWKF